MPEGITKDQVLFRLTGDRLRVGVQGFPPLLEGQLHAPVDPEASAWIIKDDRSLEVSLQKRSEGPMWLELLTGDRRGEYIVSEEQAALIHQRLTHLTAEDLLRSYSRHDLMIDPFEDNVSEVRFRKQRVEMERRMSHYLTVPANQEETPPVRRVRFESDHQDYSSKEGASRPTSGSALRPSLRAPDTAALLDEQSPRLDRRRRDEAKGDAALKANVTDNQEDQEQQKLSRCLSDPGPNKDEDEDGSFTS